MYFPGKKLRAGAFKTYLLGEKLRAGAFFGTDLAKRRGAGAFKTEFLVRRRGAVAYGTSFPAGRCFKERVRGIAQNETSIEGAAVRVAPNLQNTVASVV